MTVPGVARRLCAGALALSLAACQTTSGTPVATLQPGQTPSAASVEGGLWQQMEKLERRARTSGDRLEDPALEAYLKGISCRLAPDYCGDIRIFIMEVPGLNASMAPNGMMIVQSGLLLRAENEAQLAAVIGHEIAHYQRRHTLQRMQELWAQTDTAAFIQLAGVLVGVPIGGIAMLAAAGNVQQFSRTQEREADRLGQEMMAKAGYRPEEAARVWDNLIAEDAVSDSPREYGFLSSHPRPQERAETLSAHADVYVANELGEGGYGREDHIAAVGPYYDRWLREELRHGDMGAFRVLLDRLQAQQAVPGTVAYYEGEYYRIRARPGDLEQARNAYRTALTLPDTPPQAYRELALIEWKLESREQARGSFQRYLEAAPEAPDRLIILSYIEDLQ